MAQPVSQPAVYANGLIMYETSEFFTWWEFSLCIIYWRFWNTTVSLSVEVSVKYSSKQYHKISLFHRACFTYSLLIYPTTALYLEHLIVYVWTTPTCFGCQATIIRESTCTSLITHLHIYTLVPASLLCGSFPIRCTLACSADCKCVNE
jgi:hypothetical protein